LTRLTPIPLAEMDTAQRRVADAALSGRRRYIPAPLAAWLRNPAMAMHAQMLGESIRFDLHLPAVVIAIAALTAAIHWRAPYVQGVQTAKLQAEGFGERQIEAITAGTPPALADPAQATAYDVTRRLLDGRGLDDDIYGEAVRVLGEQGMVELVSAIGYYTLVSLTDATFGITVPEQPA
jgi:4-carboxymuconolactone decarboxylase